MNASVRVRFAPSPTGPLHIGGLRTALYNYLFAKKNNGTFILRIEDTDNSRFVEGAEKYILEALKWCSINIDEGYSVGGPHEPYKQSERKSIYKKYALELINNGCAYYAFDTPGELEAIRTVKSASYNYINRMTMKNSLTLPETEVKDLLNKNHPYVIRIKLPRNEILQVTDLIRGKITFNTSELDDKVLFKSDGMPTYHLANVVDDYLMGITHVIRGEEWLPSMPLHVLIYKYLQISDKIPHFAHLPLLLNPSGKGKLSKRDSDKLNIPIFPLTWQPKNSKEAYLGFKEAGYEPEAIVNMLALLGWNPGTNQELFSMQELIKAFSIDKISKSGAKFNIEKAKWFNEQNIREKDPVYFLGLLKKQLKENNISCNDDKYLLKIISLIKEKLTFRTQLWNQSYYFFQSPKNLDTSLIKNFNNTHKDFLKLLINNFKKHNGELLAGDIENIFNETALSLNIKSKDMLKAFRISISGLPSGPPVFIIAELIGKEKLTSNINSFLTENN
ncbi:MAG: glutamate--tRNA ligase [Solitalea-like symbiont of Acarus siro]